MGCEKQTVQLFEGESSSGIDKWWIGISSETAEDGTTQEDNSYAEIGADVN